MHCEFEPLPDPGRMTLATRQQPLAVRRVLRAGRLC